MLPRWYPNPLHPADGNFIEKHCLCISERVPVVVAFVKGLKVADQTVHFTKHSENFVEFKLYYKLNDGLLFWIANPIRYYQCQLTLYKQIKQHYGLPALSHVHVLGRSALLAIYLRLKGIPFVVSEHWSGYYKESKKLTRLKSLLYKQILKLSSGVSAVSHSLAQAIESALTIKKVEVIPNVVDGVFFTTKIKQCNLKRKKIVHISNLKNDIKQTDKLLHAIDEIASSRNDFELVIIGDGPDKSKLELQVAKSEKLQNKVSFTGDIGQDDIANILKDAFMTVSFSKYETQSIVLLESLAMMVPIIAPKIGGITEYATKYGELFEVNSLVEFKEKVISLLDREATDRQSETRKFIADNYSCNAVNNQFIAFYKKVMPSLHV